MERVRRPGVGSGWPWGEGSKQTGNVEWTAAFGRGCLTAPAGSDTWAWCKKNGRETRTCGRQELEWARTFRCRVPSAALTDAAMEYLRFGKTTTAMETDYGTWHLFADVAASAKARCEGLTPLDLLTLAVDAEGKAAPVAFLCLTTRRGEDCHLFLRLVEAWQ